MEKYEVQLVNHDIHSEIRKPFILEFDRSTDRLLSEIYLVGKIGCFTFTLFRELSALFIYLKPFRS